MIEVGDLVRQIDFDHHWEQLESLAHRSLRRRGVWLVIQVDSWVWSCQAIQGSKKEWFDINHVEVLTHD